MLELLYLSSLCAAGYWLANSIKHSTVESQQAQDCTMQMTAPCQHKANGPRQLWLGYFHSSWICIENPDLPLARGLLTAW